MRQRLQKILSARGLASRREAEEWIRAGRVRVNGAVASLGDGADPEQDEILLDGKPLPRQEAPVYLMLNKPRGYVTTLSDEKGRKTAAELVADCPTRVYPVGRLDMDSQGLLLFTNDGALAHALMHPSGEVEKTYLVGVTGASPEALEKLRRPVTLDGYRIRPPRVFLVHGKGESALVRVVIHEGRNRQIRRMCDLAGLRVVSLTRVGEGCLKLGELPLGKWRYLTEREIQTLKKEL